jgi:hypothetical protein
MSATSEAITLTKLDAARHQLETAAKLWLESEDPVSIHTLVAAAHRVVHDIAEHQGSGAVLLDRSRLSEWGYDPKEFKKAIRQAETFFKHAKNDPDESYSFSPKQTEYIFYSAVECYHRLAPQKSVLLARLLAWFYFRHPETLSVSAPEFR